MAGLGHETNGEKKLSYSEEMKTLYLCCGPRTPLVLWHARTRSARRRERQSSSVVRTRRRTAHRRVEGRTDLFLRILDVRRAD